MDGDHPYGSYGRFGQFGQFGCFGQFGQDHFGNLNHTARLTDRIKRVIIYTTKEHTMATLQQKQQLIEIN